MINATAVALTLEDQLFSRVAVPCPRRGYLRDMRVLLNVSNKFVTLALAPIASLDDVPDGVEAADYIILHSIITVFMVATGVYQHSQHSKPVDNNPGLWDCTEPYVDSPLYLWGINQSDGSTVEVKALLTFDGPDLTRS